MITIMILIKTIITKLTCWIREGSPHSQNSGQHHLLSENKSLSKNLMQEISAMNLKLINFENKAPSGILHGPPIKTKRTPAWRV